MNISRAYPRVCGATPAAAMVRADPEGLSPRVRGNLPRGGFGWHGRGPIPACAGQPASRSSSVRLLRAYPRVCGATQRFSKHVDNDRGLSPRVRGNRVNAAIRGNNQGPIPACAGQPGGRITRRQRAWAYPRVCGATDLNHVSSSFKTGLSPRVRGNLVLIAGFASEHGPIPACAGQPKRRSFIGHSYRAYPRVCGATLHSSLPPLTLCGLSPRVRGNHTTA